MRDVFGEAKQRLTREINSNSALAEKPIATDPWVVSSLLQKSIRRSELEIAQCAAFTFFKLRGSAIWRRLTVIAFEDIGIGRVDALTMIVAAADDSAWRKNHGDMKLAVHLAGVLSEAPKDRSADYLCGAKDHPALAGFAQAMANTALKSRLSHVHDKALGLPQRAIAALSAPGIGSRGEISRGTGGLDALLAVFHELGVPKELVAATGIAAARTPRADYAHGAVDLACGKQQAKEQVCDRANPAAGRGRRRAALCVGQAHAARARSDLALCLRERFRAGLPCALRPSEPAAERGLRGGLLCRRRPDRPAADVGSIRGARDLRDRARSRSMPACPPRASSRCLEPCGPISGTSMNCERKFSPRSQAVPSRSSRAGAR